MKTALVLRHLAFEDLDCLHAVLEGAGYAIQYVEMGVTSLALYPALGICLGAQLMAAMPAEFLGHTVGF